MVVRHTMLEDKYIKGLLMTKPRGRYIGISNSGRYHIYQDNDIYILIKKGSD